jgi:hypothetical protein
MIQIVPTPREHSLPDELMELVIERGSTRRSPVPVLRRLPLGWSNSSMKLVTADVARTSEMNSSMPAPQEVVASAAPSP